MLARSLAGLLILTTALLLVSPASRLLCGPSSHRAWQRRATAPASILAAKGATEEHSAAATVCDLDRLVLLPTAKYTAADTLARPAGVLLHLVRPCPRQYSTVFLGPPRQPLVLRT